MYISLLFHIPEPSANLPLERSFPLLLYPDDDHSCYREIYCSLQTFLQVDMDIITFSIIFNCCRISDAPNNIKIVIKYLLVVLFTSLLLNFPKFLETSASWGEKMVFNTSCDGEGEEMMETWVKMSVTRLRMNTTYIHISSLVRYVGKSWTGKTDLCEFHIVPYHTFLVNIFGVYHFPTCTPCLLLNDTNIFLCFCVILDFIDTLMLPYKFPDMTKRVESILWCHKI